MDTGQGPLNDTPDQGNPGGHPNQGTRTGPSRDQGHPEEANPPQQSPSVGSPSEGLLSSTQVPEWYVENNPYIEQGYRPVSNSFWQSLKSLGRLHNETVNVFTHLIPAALSGLSLAATLPNEPDEVHANLLLLPVLFIVFILGLILVPLFLLLLPILIIGFIILLPIFILFLPVILIIGIPIILIIGFFLLVFGIPILLIIGFILLVIGIPIILFIGFLLLVFGLPLLLIIGIPILLIIGGFLLIIGLPLLLIIGGFLLIIGLPILLIIGIPIVIVIGFVILLIIGGFLLFIGLPILLILGIPVLIIGGIILLAIIFGIPLLVIGIPLLLIFGIPILLIIGFVIFLIVGAVLLFLGLPLLVIIGLPVLIIIGIVLLILVGGTLLLLFLGFLLLIFLIPLVIILIFTLPLWLPIFLIALPFIVLIIAFIGLGPLLLLPVIFIILVILLLIPFVNIPVILLLPLILALIWSAVNPLRIIFVIVILDALLMLMPGIRLRLLPIPHIGFGLGIFAPPLGPVGFLVVGILLIPLIIALFVITGVLTVTNPPLGEPGTSTMSLRLRPIASLTRRRVLPAALTAAVAWAISRFLCYLRHDVGFRLLLPADSAHRTAFIIFLSTVFLCMSSSASYHTLLNCSPRVSQFCLQLDYIGIIVLIAGSVISGVYLEFLRRPFLRAVYIALELVLAVVAVGVVLSPDQQAPESRAFRVGVFVAFAASAVVPILHGTAIFGLRRCMSRGLPYYLLEGVIYILGTFFYMSHYPERLWRGTFDIFGASHQLFHILVVVGIMIHGVGLWHSIPGW